MFGMIVTLVGAIVLLAALFGGLATIAGEQDKGGTIISNCMTALFLYILVIAMFGVKGNGVFSGGILQSGVPLIGDIDTYGSVGALVSNQPSKFALDFVELVTLTVIINWISQFFGSEGGFAGMVVKKIIVVLVGTLLYGMFMEFVRENIFMKWAVYAVECLITGGAILITPAMLLSALTRQSQDSFAVRYAISQFPNTRIGRAVSSAITSSVMLIVVIVVLESQYGSIKNIFSGLIGSMGGIGTIVVMIMGIYFIISALKK